MLNKNFILLTKKDKFIWLMSNEDKTIITKLSEFLMLSSENIESEASINNVIFNICFVPSFQKI